MTTSPDTPGRVLAWIITCCLATLAASGTWWAITGMLR